MIRLFRPWNVTSVDNVRMVRSVAATGCAHFIVDELFEEKFEKQLKRRGGRTGNLSWLASLSRDKISPSQKYYPGHTESNWIRFTSFLRLELYQMLSRTFSLSL